MLTSVEKMLGQKYPPGSSGSIETFNDLPEELVRIARSLILKHDSMLAAVAFLDHYVVKMMKYDQFIDQVLIEKRVSATEWGKYDLFVHPKDRISLWLRQESTELLAPLFKMDADSLYQIVPTNRTWWSTGNGGAPGIIVEQAPYWFQPSSGLTSSYLTATYPTLLEEDKIAVTVRRWIASRVARDCQRFEPNDVNSLAKICTKLKLREEEMSATACLSINGLLKSGWPKDRPVLDPERPGRMMNENMLPPGFTGPDELYE